MLSVSRGVALETPRRNEMQAAYLAVEAPLKPPPEPEPDNPEPPADLAHEQWLGRMREFGRRTLGALLEELEKPTENTKPGTSGLLVPRCRTRIQARRRHKERKPILYQFSHHEVTMMRLALGVALRQFEDCRDGEAPQMLAYINQPSWSEASQAARTMIERLSVPDVVVMINAPPELRLD